MEFIDVDLLKPNPKNRNKHSDEQIERLAEIIKYQGWRHPIVIDQHNMIWAGHGRVLAAKKLGEKQVPVSRQEFLSDDQAYAFLVSDNAIASWSELDLSGVNMDLADLGPDFDLDILGIKDFMLEPVNFAPGTGEDQGKLDQKAPMVTQCPNCGECFDANENKPKN